MSSDHELLELAAKAVGIDAQYSDNCGDFSIGKPYSRVEVRWNPLTFDGDALRLAVKLGMDVDVHRQEPTGGVAGVEVRGYVYRRILVTEPAADNGHALEVATRRAIVRAAAEIGRNM